MRPGTNVLGSPSAVKVISAVARQRRLGERAERREVERVVVAKPRRPGGKRGAQAIADRAPARELDAVALAIVEPHGLDAVELVERPGEAGRGILAAGEQDQGGMLLSSVMDIIALRKKRRVGPARRAGALGAFFTSPRLRGEVPTFERSEESRVRGRLHKLRTCGEAPSPGASRRPLPASGER